MNIRAYDALISADSGVATIGSCAWRHTDHPDHPDLHRDRQPHGQNHPMRRLGERLSTGLRVVDRLATPVMAQRARGGPYIYTSALRGEVVLICRDGRASCAISPRRRGPMRIHGCQGQPLSLGR
jgi:hypothetical protein